MRSLLQSFYGTRPAYCKVVTPKHTRNLELFRDPLQLSCEVIFFLCEKVSLIHVSAVHLLHCLHHIATNIQQLMVNLAFPGFCSLKKWAKCFVLFVLFCVRGHCKSVFVIYKNTVNKSGSSDDLFYPYKWLSLGKALQHHDLEP